MRRLDEIKYELEQIAEKEAMKVFRMARRARMHGCSAEMVSRIRNEAFTLHRTMTAYPERLLDPFVKWEFAFK